ncbi:MAG: hypothetical protein JWM76_4448, partial [Pseudonocardiales bacterium]|nr:hypothetical protein [Pseudonocardiales bacterium]
MTWADRAGLERELDRLIRAATTGTSVAILGVGGIGKSTLVTGAVDRARAAGVRVASAAANQLTARQ